MFGQFVWAEPHLRRQSQFVPKFELLAKSYPEPIVKEHVRRTIFGRHKEYDVHLLTLNAFMRTIDHPTGDTLYFDLDETTVCMKKEDLLSDIGNVQFPDGFDRISFGEKARYAYLQMQFKNRPDKQMLWGAFQMIWRGINQKEAQDRTIKFERNNKVFMEMNI
jgi:hypothetical protein